MSEMMLIVSSPPAVPSSLPGWPDWTPRKLDKQRSVTFASIDTMEPIEEDLPQVRFLLNHSPQVVEVRSEELLAPALLCHKEPELDLYSIRAPIIGPFSAWMPPIPLP